ncbi:MAG TPA: 16S rRNA (adenine(1518)-N(6)/adenine(1519)-N(6))-dimethyltransferase RsmA [Gemmatimonadales bacterium]|nr:16S rRNA (adenine(1518)-N(6)/adenine(1519)-N(6))-dimethyltransferase RsmA [Gemmatimonadales bacterium]
MTGRRRLGQHFLTDPRILERIVDALDRAPGDVVLEIGAGKGSLTAVLVRRGLHVIAIEKDRVLARRLELAATGAAVVTGDALRLDWHALVAARHPAGVAFSVVGNIPYQITSPLIEQALTPPLPRRIVFLVQREVAERLAAQPGSKAYGGLSVGVQVVCRVEQLFGVAAGAFHPPPKVTSAVVRLVPLAEPLIGPGETARFRAFVTACFTRRRKQLRNVVMAATGRPAAVVGAGLEALGLDPRGRPETLDPREFVRLLRWSDGL